MIANHRISIAVAGTEIKGWSSYTLDVSMLRPADSFTLTAPFSRKVWDLCTPDMPIRIFVDDVNVLTGFIDDREKPSGQDTITIAGRDRVGRLVQESAPSIDFQKMTATGLIRAAADPWFTLIKTSNLENRQVMRGRGAKVKSASEPVFLDTRRSTRIDPGQMRWTVIEEVLRQTGWLAWSSGDGLSLIVAKPNYFQPPQYRIFHPAEKTKRGSEGNAISFGVADSTGDRYSKIVVVGSGQGDASNYGDGVAARIGTAKDNELTADGDGADFTAPKRLLILEDLQSRAEATAFAKREMARRKASGHRVTVTMPGHGQSYGPGARPTLYAVDTMAVVQDEMTGIYGEYMIASLKFSSSRDAGETTELDLIPYGTEVFL